MRELIKEQLRSCTFANVSHVKKTDGGYVVSIPRYSKPKYDIGKMYLIAFADEIIGNTTSDLAKTLNRNTAPSTKYTKAYVARQSGKHLYLDTMGYDMNLYKDLSIYWSGWVSVDDITLITKL